MEFLSNWNVFLTHKHSAFVVSILRLTIIFGRSAGRYEVDGYVYNSAEEPKILMTGKWNEFMSYQPCDMEGEPLPNTELKEVIIVLNLS